MDLQNSFVVPSDIETAWKTLQDVEGLAPCMPGATLTSHDGDDFDRQRQGQARPGER